MKIILLLTILTVSLTANEFTNGVHVENKDNKKYIIKFSHNSMTTKICNIKKPTKKIKNGIVSIVDRKDKNFKIISKENKNHFIKLNVTGEINKKSKVSCICVRSCTIRVKGLGKKVVNSGDILLIENSKLKVK